MYFFTSGSEVSTCGAYRSSVGGFLQKVRGMSIGMLSMMELHSLHSPGFYYLVMLLLLRPIIVFTFLIYLFSSVTVFQLCGLATSRAVSIFSLKIQRISVSHTNIDRKNEMCRTI